MTKTLAALALAAALIAPSAAAAAPAPISMTTAQRLAGSHVDHLCGTPAHRTCTSYAVAPPEFCGRHGLTVECDYAIWHREDKWQCDGRVLIARVNGHLTVRPKDAQRCHSTYRL